MTVRMGAAGRHFRETGPGSWYSRFLRSLEEQRRSVSHIGDSEVDVEDRSITQELRTIELPHGDFEQKSSKSCWGRVTIRRTFGTLAVCIKGSEGRME